ncbi:hypothetical protein, partial [Planococcus sp. CP5-4_UN]|uniref:hypothetical protein n=1 Tax=Planococcus sp. CP5-4_UN TaxID=2850852 RepID=UPI001C2C913F
MEKPESRWIISISKKKTAEIPQRFSQAVEKPRQLFCVSLQPDAFRGHGLSRFVAGAPAGSSARAVPAGVAGFRFTVGFFDYSIPANRRILTKRKGVSEPCWVLFKIIVMTLNGL